MARFGRKALLVLLYPKGSRFRPILLCPEPLLSMAPRFKWGCSRFQGPKGSAFFRPRVLPGRDKGLATGNPSKGG